MIEDKATEKWKERAKKMGLIVNMGADEPKSEPAPDRKVKAEAAKTGKKAGKK
jgi:hypothetical protein